MLNVLIINTDLFIHSVQKTNVIPKEGISFRIYPKHLYAMNKETPLFMLDIFRNTISFKYNQYITVAPFEPLDRIDFNKIVDVKNIIQIILKETLRLQDSKLNVIIIDDKETNNIDILRNISIQIHDSRKFDFVHNVISYNEYFEPMDKLK